MAKGKVYYGIDMGAPHAGFYGWRWDTEGDGILTNYDRSQWDECVERIRSDYTSGRDVVLGIEAAMSGAKLKTAHEKSKNIGQWVPRFSIVIGNREFQEFLWYSSAGASTSVMAQIFLKDVCTNLRFKPGKRIKVYETYISGLSPVKHKKGKSKPKKPLILIDDKNKASHREDSLEALIMTFEADSGKSFDVSLLRKAHQETSEFRFKGSWRSAHGTNTIHEEKELFKLGLLETQKHFELVENVILITGRSFPDKKAS